MGKAPPLPAGLRILCVDNHRSSSERLIGLLTRAGHHAEGADDGEEGWTKLAENLNFFEAVVTDHQLPRLNGLGLVERLRHAHYPGRIVVVSPPLGPEDTKAYRRLAVDAILPKGMAEDELLEGMAACYAARVPRSPVSSLFWPTGN